MSKHSKKKYSDKKRAKDEAIVKKYRERRAKLAEMRNVYYNAVRRLRYHHKKK